MNIALASLICRSRYELVAARHCRQAHVGSYVKLTVKLVGHTVPFMDTLLYVDCLTSVIANHSNEFASANKTWYKTASQGLASLELSSRFEDRF